MHLSKRWKNIRSAVVSWFFVPTVIVLAGVAILTYLSYQSVTNDLIIERDQEFTYLSAARLREELSKYTDILTVLSRTSDLYNAQPVVQQAGLIKGKQRLSVFDGGVVVLDNLGKVVATQPDQPLILGQDWSDREYFSQLLANQAEVFSDIVNDGPQASKVIALAVPVKGPSGELRGALVGMFRVGVTTISPFYASVVRLRVSEGGSTYLVDSKGRIIYQTDISRTGENISGREGVTQVLTGQSGAMRVRNDSGQDVVSAFAPVPGTSWGLITEEDWSILTAPTRRFGQVLLVLLGLGMVLPTLGVTQLVRQRNQEALERERINNELRVAQIIQKTLLPKDLPVLPGWEIAVHWQPARAVSGDFYDFMHFQDGKIGVVMADVTDKGVPAGLVMASTRSILRGVSERIKSPGEVLERVNNLLCNDIPRNMFVTCMYGVLDSETGQFVYANAGQNLPYRKCDAEVAEVEATGFPLGLMPDMKYEECETYIQPGELLLFYSDGLVEAHNPHQEMYGNQRMEKMLQGTLKVDLPGSEMIDTLLASLRDFTGEGWDQEDDVTLVTVKRLPAARDEKSALERDLQGE
jgi:serine phosphatase RsbU (regulator of sigma subunit)